MTEEVQPEWIDKLRQAVQKRDQLGTQVEQAKNAFQQAIGEIKGIISGAGVTPEEAQKALTEP